MVTDPRPPVRAGIGAARLGVLVNLVLAIFKGLAGILGNSYALIADAVESVADIAGGLVVWGGLSVASRDADHDHPYGHGKAEPLATAVVGIMLLGAALGIMIEAVREVLTPHAAPAPFTLAVLVGVVVVKETLFRRVLRAAVVDASGTVRADAWHHRSDAITSGAAFLGISAALLGGPGWEWCDEAAALVASCVILANGVRILRPAVHELMDGAPDEAFLEAVSRAALATPGVRQIEKLRARRVGTGFDVDLHVQGDPALTLHEAHILSGIVKGRIRSSVPAVCHVLVHMEPYEPR